MRKEPEEVEKESDEKQEHANGSDELGGRNTHETDRKRPAAPCQPVGAARCRCDATRVGPHSRMGSTQLKPQAAIVIGTLLKIKSADFNVKSRLVQLRQFWVSMSLIAAFFMMSSATEYRLQAPLQNTFASNVPHGRRVIPRVSSVPRMPPLRRT